MTEKQKRSNHMWEFDLRKHGSHGIRKINQDTGKEDIRTKPIPTESERIRKIKNIIDNKSRKKV